MEVWSSQPDLKPLEDMFFCDTYLPAWLADGIPESDKHAAEQCHTEHDRSFYALNKHIYLDIPDWEGRLWDGESFFFCG